MKEKLNSLLQWLEASNNFYLNESVEIFETNESGRGAHLCSGRLKTNDLITSVPSSHQLNFHTVIYHIAKFNTNIVIQGVTPLTSDSRTNEDFDPLVENVDPRYKAYSVFDAKLLLSMSSFQLLSLYILAEWKLLPLWGNGNFHSFWEPFFDVLPTRADLRSIPARWLNEYPPVNVSLINLLPQSCYENSLRISKLLNDDWRCISPILEQWKEMFNESSSPSLADLYQEFIQIYFIINSRCLYMELPLKTNPEDNLTMVPFVDFLNHAPLTETYCYPRIDRMKRNTYGIGSFSIRCGPHEYVQKGEEIFLNYGAHSNDFLINEYGFVLDENRWNCIDISTEVKSMIQIPAHKRFLMENDYWGDYTITHEEISFRVLVALALCSSNDIRKVEKFMMGFLPDDVFKPHLDNLLRIILENVTAKTKEKIESILELNDVDAFCQQNVLKIYKGYLCILSHHLGQA